MYRLVNNNEYTRYASFYTKSLSLLTVYFDIFSCATLESAVSREVNWQGKAYLSIFFHIRGMIKNYVDFSNSFEIDHSNAFKLSQQMPSCYMHMSAKFRYDISIHFKIIVNPKHTPLPSRSSPLTLMTSKRIVHF